MTRYMEEYDRLLRRDEERMQRKIRALKGEERIGIHNRGESVTDTRTYGKRATDR